ncbi:MAG: hypothetical protein IJW20_01260 [Clostridia bacterium]|nr:hypothetical protein [Clostridia bacterium]
MKKNKTMKKLVLVIFILFFCLLCLLLALQKFENQENIKVSTEGMVHIEEKPENPEEVMEKYESTHIDKSEEDNIIYATLAKDLYNEDGSSNEKFVKDLVDDLKPFYENEDFSIIDKNRKITIDADYDQESETYDIIINGVEEFYDNTDGKDYVAVQDSEIVKGTNFTVREYFLNKLEVHDGYFSQIASELGEGTELDNGYTSYKDGLIKIRTVDTGAVRNIIYDSSYETYYTNQIKNGMSLKEIEEYEPKHDFGSVEEGYLGYRQFSFYIFFYPEEVSVYSYAYRENEKFEWILSEYLEDGDLEQFVDRIKKKWKVYDKLEYNPETQSAYILISTRGVEIDIKNNNPKGVKLYSNYYFTDYTRQLVKNGKISFEANTDLVNEVEKERRNSD